APHPGITPDSLLPNEPQPASLSARRDLGCVARSDRENACTRTRRGLLRGRASEPRPPNHHRLCAGGAPDPILLAVAPACSRGRLAIAIVLLASAVAARVTANDASDALPLGDALLGHNCTVTVARGVGAHRG